MCNCEECKNKGLDGSVYVPYAERTGNESIVYFTRDLSAEGLKKMYDRISEHLTGKVAVKLHTGEPHGPNIIPRPWVKELMAEKLPEAAIVETNTYYEGPRMETAGHRETIALNGWTFAPVDILDEEGTINMPVKGGKWFTEMSLGGHIVNYDSMLALTHFKGHTVGGFGGSNKNLGIGCADGKVGKAMIHTVEGSDDQWSILQEEFMERMSESAKSVVDYFGKHLAYINVMRNMSVSCDCAGVEAEPVETPDVGIMASVDMLAIDQACIDVIFAMNETFGSAMRERITTRHGLRQLSYMKEMGVGNDRYVLIDIDNGDVRITAEDCTVGLKPFVY